MAEFASNGKGNLGVTLGAIGTGLSVLNGGLGNILGLGNANCCSENMMINRYELNLTQELAKKDQHIALLEADKYTDQKIVDVTTYFNNKIDNINNQLAQQAVYNATQTSTMNCMAQQIAQLQGLTKIIVPIDNICPQPMPQYNSWTAPTTTTTTSPSA